MTPLAVRNVRLNASGPSHALKCVQSTTRRRRRTRRTRRSRRRSSKGKERRRRRRRRRGRRRRTTTTRESGADKEKHFANGEEIVVVVFAMVIVALREDRDRYSCCGVSWQKIMATYGVVVMVGGLMVLSLVVEPGVVAHSSVVNESSSSSSSSVASACQFPASASRFGKLRWGTREAVVTVLGLRQYHEDVRQIVSDDGSEEEDQDCVKITRLPPGGAAAADSFATGDDAPDPDYRKNWPKFEPGWRLAIGTVLAFLGAAFGSVGGVGGGGFYLPILSLVIGFDSKTTTALSKSMIMGAAFAAVVYNLKQCHPTRNEPVIDYDIALLFQPMLLLGISIGVTFNIMFADWMVTLLLILLFSSIVVSAFRKAICTWNQECQSAKVEDPSLPITSTGCEKGLVQEEVEYIALPAENCQPTCEPAYEPIERRTLQQNVQWKSMGLLFVVWLVFLALQLLKNQAATCSIWYWVVNGAQIPVALGVTGFQAWWLYRKSQIASNTHHEAQLDYALTDLNWGVTKLAIYAGSAVTAGTMGGLLGIGGGTIIGPFLLELGLPPQVSAATATFVMLFSASMSVVEYSLLGRLPRDHAIFLTTLAAVGALWGQSMVRRVILASGKTSIIIFMLATCIAFSAVVLGLQGMLKVYEEWQAGSYMGFEDLCST